MVGRRLRLRAPGSNDFKLAVARLCMLLVADIVWHRMREGLLIDRVTQAWKYVVDGARGELETLGVYSLR